MTNRDHISSLGITGGIGSGKSYVCRLLEQRGIPVFYTDDEAKQQMREDPGIHAELSRLIGPEVVDGQGRIVKSVIADYICQGDSNAQAVNRIVHPRVRERMRRWINGGYKSAYAYNHSAQISATRSSVPLSRSQARPGLSGVIAVECALLFEASWEGDLDKVITVAAPHSVRVNRIVARDHITPAKAEEWIRLQMPQEEKERRSDFVILNDGHHDLDAQITDILRQIGGMTGE